CRPSCTASSSSSSEAAGAAARGSRATAVARRRRSVARTGSQAAELGVEGFARDAETARGGALRGLLLEALADERELDPRDDARPHAAHAVGTHRLHFLVLQDAEQLRLHGRRRLADLVEEDGALARLLEEPAAVALGAGEGPAQVAEELALEERLGEGGAVLHQERRLRARAAVVDGARQELL